MAEQPAVDAAECGCRGSCWGAWEGRTMKRFWLVFVLGMAVAVAVVAVLALGYGTGG